MRVGTIGLGNIGGAIAANLVEDGHAVTVCDLDAERVRAVAERGAAVADDPAAVARASDVTFLSLPTPEVVASVAEAWLAGAAAGSVLVDLSTNSPAAVRALGARVSARGAALLEAPLTGGAPGARARQLVFLLGGEPAVVETCRPLLDRLGRAVFHFGPLGTGNTAKLVNTLLALSSAWVTFEGLALGAKSGLDLRTLVDAVRTGGATNYFIERMVEGINQRGRPANFSLALAAKDAGLIESAMAEQAIPAPFATALAAVFRAAVAGGLGDRDWSDLVEHAEREAGQKLELRPKPPAPPRPA
jgi:3-hydroxyisobutyrate dehydrogenase-like beta-hydroxyacid dehydrogenase